ncbi:hypothetical protein MTR_7g099885 [Medicago truncatula]|uniref:Uncharacterized protein n=1 Tax=Medicago truncatula TaxID=3880 RepID=A0A072U2Q1_MEDTR|nr:hypothetical protein MTR_7g099885 [Medicago truncatula]
MPFGSLLPKFLGNRRQLTAEENENPELSSSSLPVGVINPNSKLKSILPASPQPISLQKQIQIYFQPLSLHFPLNNKRK